MTGATPWWWVVPFNGKEAVAVDKEEVGGVFRKCSDTCKALGGPEEVGGGGGFHREEGGVGVVGRRGKGLPRAAWHLKQTLFLSVLRGMRHAVHVQNGELGGRPSKERSCVFV